jgi:hypothetical protein
LFLVKCLRGTYFCIMRDIGKIEEIVRDTLAADFEKIHVSDVQVREEVGWDGDDLLHVYVVYEKAPKHADIRRLLGAVRRVRPKLTEVGETAFPLFSFISRDEVGAGKFEPA